MDDRPETKIEKFNRLREARVPKITHAMGLLENLAGPSYESTETTRRELIAEIQQSVDNVAAAFGVAQAVTTIQEPVVEVIAEKPKPTKPVAGEDAKARGHDLLDELVHVARISDEIVHRADGEIAQQVHHQRENVIER